MDTGCASRLLPGRASRHAARAETDGRRAERRQVGASRVASGVSVEPSSRTYIACTNGRACAGLPGARETSLTPARSPNAAGISSSVPVGRSVLVRAGSSSGSKPWKRNPPTPRSRHAPRRAPPGQVRRRMGRPSGDGGLGDAQPVLVVTVDEWGQSCRSVWTRGSAVVASRVSIARRAGPARSRCGTLDPPVSHRIDSDRRGTRDSPFSDDPRGDPPPRRCSPVNRAGTQERRRRWPRSKNSFRPTHDITQLIVVLAAPRMSGDRLCHPG